MTFPARWPEHDLIEREYARRGRHWLANRIGRAPGTISAYATRHGLHVGDTPNSVRISELATLLGLPIATVHQRAESDGAIRRYRADTETRGTIAAVVPHDWADQYARRHAAQTQASNTAQRDGWLTTSDLVRLWRVGRGTVIRGLNGQGVLAPLLADARTARGLGPSRDGNWLMHPIDAESVRIRLDTNRTRAASMVSTKTIAIETGVKQVHAADVGRKMGGILLFTHGRLMCHVTPAIAETMRERFRQAKAPGPRPYKPRKTTTPKTCPICGATFERHATPYEAPGAYAKRRTCSKACAGRQSGATRRARKQETGG